MIVKPVMLYKAPGPHHLDGEMVDYCIVEAEDVEATLVQGWSKTIQEATTAKHIDVEHEYELVTREEIEARAIELGIKFDGRNSNATLQKKIEELCENRLG